MNVYKQRFGECEKALYYIEQEYHYTPEELFHQLSPEVEDLFEDMQRHGFLDPQNKFEEEIMRNGIDNFFDTIKSQKRRRRILLKSIC